MQVPKFAKTFERFLSNNSPSILTAVGVVGTVSTAYLAAKGAYRHALDMEENHVRGVVSQNVRLQGKKVEFLESKDVVELALPYYIPAIAAGTVTCGCIIMANRIGSKRAAALAAAYSLSDKAFDEYREKVRERLGDKEEQRYRDEIAQDRVTANPPESKDVILEPGTVLFLEDFTGRYLYSSVETLKYAQNKVNHQINIHDYASLSDFYNAAGIPTNAMSDELGWNSNKLMELYFSTTEYEGDAVMVFSYYVEPIRKYDKVH